MRTQIICLNSKNNNNEIAKYNIDDTFNLNVYSFLLNTIHIELLG